MRYRRTGEIEFTSANGITKKMYGVRRQEVFTTYAAHNKPREQELDDLAVDLWGNNAEIMSYRLREQNVDKLLSHDFNEREIVEVNIPPRLFDV